MKILLELAVPPEGVQPPVGEPLFVHDEIVVYSAETSAPLLQEPGFKELVPERAPELTDEVDELLDDAKLRGIFKRLGQEGREIGTEVDQCRGGGSFHVCA